MPPLSHPGLGAGLPILPTAPFFDSCHPEWQEQRPFASCSRNRPRRVPHCWSAGVAGAGRAALPSHQELRFPTAAHTRADSHTINPRRAFLFLRFSAQSPDTFILGASLGKVLCQRHLQATPPHSHHTHPTVPSCLSFHSLTHSACREHLKYCSRHRDTHEVSIIMEFSLRGRDG